MRKRNQERYVSYIATARALFFRYGHAAVSMHQIAAAAGGSKTTLYKYFSSKEAIFLACVLETGREKFSSITDIQVDSDDVESTLRTLADAYLEVASDPDVRQLDQLVQAEVARQPELARAYWDLTHVRALVTMALVFERLVSAQQIRSAPPRVLATHFKALLDCIVREREGRVHAAGTELEVGSTVRAFLYGYQWPDQQVD